MSEGAEHTVKPYTYTALQHAYTLRISDAMAADMGLVGGPPPRVLSRRERLRSWWRWNMNRSALRTRLADWIDPRDRGDW